MSLPGRPWHHTADGFRNPPGSPVATGGGADWRGFFWRRFVSATDPIAPADHVLARSVVTERLQRANGGDSLTWLGHASFLIRLDGRWIVTDPFLSDHASPVPPLGPKRWARPALATNELPPLDVVLVSHNHYDHLDRPTLDALPLADGATLVVPLAVGQYIDTSRFARVVELDWHQRTETHGLGLTAVPAIHFSKRSLWDGNRSLWAGFLIESGARRIVFTGDTAYGPVHAETGRAHGPVDWALVPIGAYDPRELMLQAHCNPEEAVAIGRDLGAKRLAAMHWGTIKLTDEPPFEPPERFRAAAISAGKDPDADLLLGPLGSGVSL